MRAFAVSTIAVIAVYAATAEENPFYGELKREDLGRTVKYTCVVDKVMQRHTGWVAEEWMIREAAEAGFNIYSPRTGHNDLEAVAQVTEWCGTHGIFHLPWMRGTLPAAMDDPEAEGKRVVWANGKEQPLWSPNSDPLWAWMTEYIVAYAKISANDEHLAGVFLDYENYAPGRAGVPNLYSLSFDQDILERFAAAEAIDLPSLAPAERAPWLKENDLHDRFETFQINHWRERCRALREAVDAHAPDFQFWLYPAPGTPFLQRAAYPEWATEAAPIVIADQSTYGRPRKFIPEQDALVENRAKLLRNMALLRDMGVPHHYAGGIDPIVSGADPEFCGKNAVMISEATDGYWIFYEGPEYETTHKDYWKWFTWANRAIADNRFDAQRASRETDESLVSDLVGHLDLDAFDDAVYGRDVELPACHLRRDNLLVLACKKGEPVSVTLQGIRVAAYTHDVKWTLYSPRLEIIDSGTIEHGTSGTVEFTPDEDGVRFLSVVAGGCAYAVTRANVPVAVHAGFSVSTIHAVERLYFHVPGGAERCIIQTHGSGNETVRLQVYRPDGELAGTVQTTPGTQRAEYAVAPMPQEDAVWSFALTQADEGVLEDASTKLEGIAPLVSFTPAHVFTSTE